MAEIINNEDFARLFMQNQPSLLRFVRSMVPQFADAEDVLQETAVALWKKAAEYDTEQPFLPWAMQFAKYKIYQHRRNNQNRVVLDSDVLEFLMEEGEGVDPILEKRRHHLAVCLKKLSDKSTSLLQLRFYEKLTVQQVAEESGISASTLYKVYYRIRDELAKCITNSMREELA